MQLISKYNKDFRYLLCVIDLFSKYAWVFLLKDTKGVTIVNAFQSILNNSGRKPNKYGLIKAVNSITSLLKNRLDHNDIMMYSTRNEGKSVVAERFIRTPKHKIYKHMIAVSKNVFFYELDDIVDKYNNTYHRIIKIKPIDVKSGSYAEYNVDSNAKYTK